MTAVAVPSKRLHPQMTSTRAIHVHIALPCEVSQSPDWAGQDPDVMALHTVSHSCSTTQTSYNATPTF
jgi:hypothetical protein